MYHQVTAGPSVEFAAQCFGALESIKIEGLLLPVGLQQSGHLFGCYARTCSDDEQVVVKGFPILQQHLLLVSVDTVNRLVDQLDSLGDKFVNWLYDVPLLVLPKGEEEEARLIVVLLFLINNRELPLTG